MRASQLTVFLSGFGPFEGVSRNPSGHLAEALAREPGVHAVVLPVSFHGAPRAFDAALRGAQPGVLIGLGVHPGPGFRLESRARRALGSQRPDVDGRRASEIALDGPDELGTPADLDGLAAEILADTREAVAISHDAGGYVCERLYRHALETGQRRGIPAVFLHVPPLEVLALERQIPVVRALVRALRARAAKISP
jgi:pyroglutamyl-peptidase